MDDKNKKDFDGLIIGGSNSSKPKAPNDFDALITRKTDGKSSAKSSIVTPNNSKIDINRAEKKSQIRGTTSGIITDMGDNPFNREDPKPKQTLLTDEPLDPILPMRSGFSVKNPKKDASGGPEKPTRLDATSDLITKTGGTGSTLAPLPSRQPKQTAKPTVSTDRAGKVSVKPTGERSSEKPVKAETPIVEKPKGPEPITFKKPEIKPKQADDGIIEQKKVVEHKPKAEQVLIEATEEEKQAQKKAEKAEAAEKKPEIQVVKTTTSTLKKRPGTEIPEDQSQEIGAKAGSSKYKADTRLDKRAKSLKKYGREFERWRKSQEAPDNEEIEGDVRVKEGRNSEKVITTALVLVVIMVLSIFLLFYCNIINPADNMDDGRVRISVEIDKSAFTDVDIYGNVTDRIIFPGDKFDFNIITTNAYNITGDNATAYEWDNVFVRFKIYLRIDGEVYESVKVNINGEGTKEVPVIIPTINPDLFQTYDKEKEDKYYDYIKDAPIVEASDGFYYYNGILNYNETLILCSGILLNGDAIIPDFAGKRAELVVVVDAATADYTSIRHRAIWEHAPQTWVEYMHDTHFPDLI